MSKIIINPFECGYRSFISVLKSNCTNRAIITGCYACNDDNEFPNHCPLQDGITVEQCRLRTKMAKEIADSEKPVKSVTTTQDLLEIDEEVNKPKYPTSWRDFTINDGIFDNSIMNIQIMCNQKDCIHNASNNVHHDHDNDKCEHPRPIIHTNTYPPNGVPICTSKEIKVGGKIFLAKG